MKDEGERQRMESVFGLPSSVPGQIFPSIRPSDMTLTRQNRKGISEDDGE